MKKLARLILVSLIFTFVTTACKEDDENNIDPIENNGITEADLVGDWLFESLEFEGKIYTDCNNELLGKYNLLNLSFLDVTLSEHGVATLIYYSDCGEIIRNEIPFKIKDKKIILNDNDNYAYSLLNFHDFDGETLIIKSLLNALKAPTGGIYTLKKRL